jgi:hypothetical protein
MGGTGKSISLELYRTCFGKNATALSPIQLLNQDNRYSINKQFIQVNEASTDRSKTRAQGSQIKDIITRDVLWTNPKYIAPYELPDVINYGLTSNFADGLHIDNTDRRILNIHTTEEKLPIGFADKLHDWKGVDARRAR